VPKIHAHNKANRQSWCIKNKITNQGRRHGGALGGLEPPRRGWFAPPSGNLGIFCRGWLECMHGKCSCAKFVGFFHSSDTSRMRTCGMDLETSCPRHSSSSTIHTAARFRHCCIQLSMKRWCQLNRARVAHDAHPALSSYHNKCSKPFTSQQWHLLWCLKVLLI